MTNDELAKVDPREVFGDMNNTSDGYAYQDDYAIYLNDSIDPNEYDESISPFDLVDDHNADGTDYADDITEVDLRDYEQPPVDGCDESFYDYE